MCTAQRLRLALRFFGADEALAVTVSQRVIADSIALDFFFYFAQAVFKFLPFDWIQTSALGFGLRGNAVCFRWPAAAALRSKNSMKSLLAGGGARATLEQLSD